MTWLDRTIIKILLIIAKMMARSPELTKELETLATHISVWCPKGADHD